MRTSARSAILGVVLAATLAFPALAQLDLPCDAFVRDDDGTWFATQQITVGTQIGLVDVMPGPVSLEVADVLNAVCQ
jgi:hypothetical protein